ncbi:MAG: hypothetical protein U0798_01970 [Gemmataceae bacterium]
MACRHRKRREVSKQDQYKGDLWGIYAVIGEMDPKRLATPKHPMASPSASKVASSTPDGMENADKIWEKFVAGMRNSPTEDWWRKNLDLPRLFQFSLSTACLPMWTCGPMATTAVTIAIPTDAGPRSLG